jgi:hypothetical protein
MAIRIYGDEVELRTARQVRYWIERNTRGGRKLHYEDKPDRLRKNSTLEGPYKTWLVTASFTPCGHLVRCGAEIDIDNFEADGNEEELRAACEEAGDAILDDEDNDSSSS